MSEYSATTRVEPASALETLRTFDMLTQAHIAELDAYLTHWVLVVLLRPHDPEGILTVRQLCDLAQVLLSCSVLGTGELRVRWKAFGDLLDGRSNAIRINATMPPIKLLHEDAVLQLASEGCLQSTIAASLRLSACCVSQLLGTMEAQRRIVRRQVGTEVLVSLPDARIFETSQPQRDLISRDHHAVQVSTPTS